MTKELTPKMVIDFWEYMTKEYNTQVIDKNSAKEMRWVASILHLLGIVKKRDFLNKFSTTLGNKIYIPFTIGVGDSNELENQVAICVHEHMHVLQDRKDWRYKLRYLTNSAHRAHYEADAYRSNMEMHWWYKGKLLNPKMLAGKLRHYNCSSADIKVCERNLRISAEMVKRGGIASPVSKVAIRWFEGQRLSGALTLRPFFC